MVVFRMIDILSQEYHSESKYHNLTDSPENIINNLIINIKQLRFFCNNHRKNTYFCMTRTTMKETIFKSRFFLYGYLPVLGICLILLYLYGMDPIELWINSHNSLAADSFFRIYTNVGDGLFVVVVCVLLLFYHYGTALFIFSSWLGTSIVVQFIKHIVFPDAPRPRSVLGPALHYVDGVTVHAMQSFPSGHTATAFAFFMALSILNKNKWLQLSFLLCALLAGYSRMYLSQHFITDATAGSVIGILVTVLVFILYERHHKDWMNKSLVRKR